METAHDRSHQNSQMLRAPRTATLPLPSVAYSEETPHSILTYEDPALVNYDLRRLPSDARPRYPRLVRLTWCYESAMHPAVSTLTLTCGILPQLIVVTPSHSGFEFVIVQDVLLAVHEAYQVTVNERHGPTTTDSEPSFLREHSTVLTRHMWGGISEQTAPGQWRVHIE
ncbi:hypothetical protein JOM56_000025 [Amanita muscaria]